MRYQRGESIDLDGEIGRTERTWEANLRLIDELCVSLERLGARNVVASRVGEYKRAFHQLSGGTVIPTEEVPRLLASMKDFHELRRIVAATEVVDSSEGWLAKLRAIPPGVAFPSEPDPRPDGRDTQFECFVASVMVLGGASVAFAEPDLIVTHGGQSHGVAVKRPRNAAKAEANLRKGIKQVKQSGLPGLVAVDLSTALHHGEYVHADGLQDATAAIRGSTDQAVRPLAEKLGSLALQAGVRGIIGHLMLPVVHPGSTGLNLATSARWTLVRLQESDNASDLWLDALEEICQRGLSHPLEGDESFSRGLE